MPSESPLRCHLCYLAGRGDVMPKITRQASDENGLEYEYVYRCLECGEIGWSGSGFPFCVASACEQGAIDEWNVRQRQLAELLPDLRAELERVMKERDEFKEKYNDACAVFRFRFNRGY